MGECYMGGIDKSDWNYEPSVTNPTNKSNTFVVTFPASILTASSEYAIEFEAKFVQDGITFILHVLCGFITTAATAVVTTGGGFFKAYLGNSSDSGGLYSVTKSGTTTISIVVQTEYSYVTSSNFSVIHSRLYKNKY